MSVIVKRESHVTEVSGSHSEAGRCGYDVRSKGSGHFCAEAVFSDLCFALSDEEIVEGLPLYVAPLVGETNCRLPIHTGCDPSICLSSHSSLVCEVDLQMD